MVISLIWLAHELVELRTPLHRQHSVAGHERLERNGGYLDLPRSTVLFAKRSTSSFGYSSRWRFKRIGKLPIYWLRGKETVSWKSVPRRPFMYFCARALSLLAEEVECFPLPDQSKLLRDDLVVRMLYSSSLSDPGA